MTDRLLGVQARDLGTWWPIAEPLLARAVARFPNYTLEDVHRSIAAGERQLWIRVPDHEVAVVTAITDYPAGRRLTLFALAGELRPGWQALFRSIEDWARSQGCSGVDIYGRRGWERVLPDYRLAHVVLSKELHHG